MGQRHIENTKVALVELPLTRAERSWSTTGALILQIKTMADTSSCMSATLSCILQTRVHLILLNPRSRHNYYPHFTEKRLRPQKGAICLGWPRPLHGRTRVDAHICGPAPDTEHLLVLLLWLI